MAVIKPLTNVEHLLTVREFEIFKLLGKGKTPREIGVILFLSPKTIATHRSNIMRKMHFKSTYELLHYAIKLDILTK